jgi:uncharacterized spore protein YtfJ
MAMELSNQQSADDLEATDMMDRLAARIGRDANARAVFSEPVQRDGVTVVGVAKVRWGFGGGGGSGSAQGGEGSGRGFGGGGGVQATPVGFIEVRDGVAEYRPIRDPAAIVVPIVAIGGVTALMLVRAIGKIIRG